MEKLESQSWKIKSHDCFYINYVGKITPGFWFVIHSKDPSGISVTLLQKKEYSGRHCHLPQKIPNYISVQYLLGEVTAQRFLQIRVLGCLINSEAFQGYACNQDAVIINSLISINILIALKCNCFRLKRHIKVLWRICPRAVGSHPGSQGLLPSSSPQQVPLLLLPICFTSFRYNFSHHWLIKIGLKGKFNLFL